MYDYCVLQLCFCVVFSNFILVAYHGLEKELIRRIPAIRSLAPV